jgi:hypothetical protein
MDIERKDIRPEWKLGAGFGGNYSEISNSSETEQNSSQVKLDNSKEQNEQRDTGDEQPD